MSRFSAPIRETLMPAVEAAREALADMTADEVPASLKRVVVHSGGRLPPPLVDSVLTALDESDWLREKALEKLTESDARGSSRAFLERSDGWWSLVAERAASQAAGNTAANLEKARARVDDLTRQLRVAKQRVKKAGAVLDEHKAKSRRRRAEKKDQSGKELVRERKAQAREVQRLKEQMEEAVQDRIEAEAMIARLRGRLSRVSREQRRRSGADETSSFATDPLEVARALDLMAAAAPHRGGPEPGIRQAEAVESSLKLPLGVRPDSREAVDWLRTLAEPYTLIVDGYNVLYNIDPARFTTGRSRAMLATQLARFRRAAAGPVRVIVVYDSDLPGGRDEHVGVGGVAVRFADEAHLADDEIAELSAKAKGSVVVITSDRDLQERSAAVGALPLWAEALVSWIAARSA